MNKIYRYFVLFDALRPSQRLFSVMLGWVFLGLTSTKQWIKCLAQGQNIVDLQDVESKNRLQLHVVVLIVLVYQRKYHHPCIKLIRRMLNSPSYLNLELLNSM